MGFNEIERAIQGDLMGAKWFQWRFFARVHHQT